ncbi:MAG: acyl-CoA thioesterase [Pseudomonadales bacterium]
MLLPDILESFTLERTFESESQAIFAGLAADSTGERVYGGQLMAQALSAVQQTVDSRFVVHSMQSNFYRPCFPDATVEYSVDILRTGRSFATRSVLLKQNDKPIFNATFSLHTEEQGFEHSTDMPAAPDPNTLINDEIRVNAHFEKQGIKHSYAWPIDVRFVEPAELESPEVKPPYDLVWVKANGPLPNEATIHTQMLAYASDNPISSPAFNIHGENPFVPGVQSVTLSHALWFHRPVRMDEWVLFELNSDITYGGRGLCHARVFAQSGELVASAVQEIVMRKRRA